ncbi:hypothetical protein SAMN05720467_0010 [Fibrobacter sp. UWB7]|nr:hypothetical protein SAMN05720467_0010 [Fibrobacter sp. UWB7]
MFRRRRIAFSLDVFYHVIASYNQERNGSIASILMYSTNAPVPEIRHTFVYGNNLDMALSKMEKILEHLNGKRIISRVDY